MSKHGVDNSGASVSLAIGTVLILILMLILLVVESLLSNYHIDQQFTSFRQQITQLERGGNELTRELAYVSSPQTVDKWAKASQGLAQPGERVISFDNDEYGTSALLAPQQSQQINNLLRLSPYEQWSVFFFGKVE